MGPGTNLQWVVREGPTEEETPKARKASKTKTQQKIAGPVSGGAKYYLWLS